MERTVFTATRVLLAPALAGLWGCTSMVGMVRGGHGDPPQPDRMDGLAARVEAVHVEVEIARERTRGAVTALEVLAGADERLDPLETYADFVARIEGCEEQAQSLRASAEPMVEDAEEFFGEWGSDLHTFSSPAMRNLSRDRMAATHRKYRAITGTLAPTQTLLEELNLRLRDCATFLAYDFNPGAIDAIAGDVRELGALGQRLDRRFDACLQATRTYVESTVMPAPAPAPPIAARAVGAAKTSALRPTR